jgi:sugar phosphate isomerase/epimerase
MSAAFTLSAFGDEIAVRLEEQLRVLEALDIRYLELRAADGKNVAELDDAEVEAVRQRCRAHGISVSCLGTPVGKSPVEAPLEDEERRLTRLFDIAAALGAHYLRVFSFYPPDGTPPERVDDYVGEATERLARLTDLARREGYVLLLENEKDLTGDTPQRCAAILAAINSLHLRFAWDPANFVQVGVERPTEQGWPLLRAFTEHVHIKDARLEDGGVVVAGAGDGQVGELLAHLAAQEFRGFLALEPHLVVAGRSGGFSGPDGMAQAARALRQLMATQGCQEQGAPAP